MLRLHTFGRVYLIDDSGEPLAAAAGQRRTLALLSVLAVAGEAGLSRDQIVGLLWPDSLGDRGRHSLTQTLYLARRSLGYDDVLQVGADVRLNSQRIVSDVQDLEAALSAGELERAVELYRGAFLDGFFLPGSNDFEEWVSRERNRCASRVVGALEQLADHAHDAGDQRRWVELRKRVAALKPLDSAVTVKLMSALAAVGDRAAALQQARIHEELLREQLDLSPDASVTQLSAELRERSHAVLFTEAAKQAALGDDKPMESSILLAEPLEAEDELRLAVHTRGRSSRELPPARRRGRRILAGWLAALAVVATALVIGQSRNRAPEVSALPVRQEVVVAPFRVAGASRSLEYLREGLVELLSGRLADDSSARSVDAGAVLGAWRLAGLTAAADVSRDTVVRLATRLGAERVVIGSVVGTSARAVVSASVLSLPAGTVEGEATVEGPADSITNLVDQLAARLLTSQAGEDLRIAEHTTGSLPALRAYLEGQSAYRRAAFPTALRSYARALELDTTFALAAVRLAVAAERLNDLEQQRRALASAWRFRNQLNGRELAHLIALAGPRYPHASTAVEQLAAWEQLVSLAPDRAEAWYELGTRLFRDGTTVGLPGARERAARAFQRALTLDPTFYLARNFLIQLAIRPGSGLELAELAPSGDASDSLGPLSPFIQWRIAVARGDSAGLRAMQDTLAQLGPVNLRTIAMASQFDAVAITDGARAVDVLWRRANRASERFDAGLALHSLAVIQGKPSAALERSTRLAEIDPRARVHLRLRVLDWLYAEGDSAAADHAGQALETLVSTADVGSAPDTHAADLCVVAQWRLARSDTAGVRDAVAQLRKADVLQPTTYVSASPFVCAELLNAALATRTIGRKALKEIQWLDSLALNPAVSGDASAYTHLMIARLYRDLGEPRAALQAIRRRPYMIGWPRYLATAWREEAALAEAVGDKAGALEAYERFLALRTATEPPLVPDTETIRQRAARLVTGNGDGG